MPECCSRMARGRLLTQMNHFVMMPSQTGNHFGPPHAAAMPAPDHLPNQIVGHYNGINVTSNANAGHQFPPQLKNNKRGSVDYSNGMPDYSKTAVETWMNSPRSVTSDDSIENNQNQNIKGFPKSLVNYPNNVKRQNVGQWHSLNNISPQFISQNPRGINAMSQVTFSHNPMQSGVPMVQQRSAYLPAPAGNVAFYGTPRILDLQGQVTPAMQHPRLPVQYILQPRMQPFNPRMPTPAMSMQTAPPHMLQHQHQTPYAPNPAQQQPMGPPPPTGPPPDQHNSSEKKARFLRTAQILEQSGLMECTLKTAALMKENAALQKEIDALTAETEALIAQYLNMPRDVSQMTIMHQMPPQSMFPNQQQFTQPPPGMLPPIRQGTATSMTSGVPYMHPAGMI
ncbi:uncharacterized protein LOC129590108 isoform X2 [Paramacrobiotus metropolitanus]|nr:uncharacterized protein LOC129590108 isoform X2 [Paramacrobiotus metropolitanus]